MNRHCWENLIVPEIIDDSHQLIKNNDQVNQLFQFKKELKDLAADDLDLPIETKIFVNQSLCQYCRILWSKTEQLQSKG